MKNLQAIYTADQFELIPTSKRVRAFFNNEIIADSSDVVILREQMHLPVYYFPRGDIRNDHLEPTGHHTRCPHKGEASYWTVIVGDRTSENAAWAYSDPSEHEGILSEYMAFYWKQMDAWFEEDEKVEVHARDPFHRIDVLKSSRHVKVVVQGETIAESHRPTLLFETGLPVRYYLPRLDVQFQFLEPSSLRTYCPYKGEARYYHVNTGEGIKENIIWTYPYPRMEAFAVADQLCFYQKRTDEFMVSLV
ncbi:MAG: DUF427 domain-containing protein [Balneolales bacterium]